MTNVHGALAVALMAGSFMVAPAFAGGLGGTLGGTIGATVGGAGGSIGAGAGASGGASPMNPASGGGSDFGGGGNVDVSVTIGLNRSLNPNMPELAPDRANKPRIVNLDELSGHATVGANAEAKADQASELVKRLKERKQQKQSGAATLAPSAQWNGEGGPLDEKTAAENAAATASTSSDVSATLSTIGKANAEADTKVPDKSRNWFDIF